MKEWLVQMYAIPLMKTKPIWRSVRLMHIGPKCYATVIPPIEESSFEEAAQLAKRIKELHRKNRVRILWTKTGDVIPAELL